MSERSKHLHGMTLCALFAALLCITSPLALPVGPIPISLGLLSVFLVAIVLGPWRAAVSVLLFLALGAVGLPVFSAGQGGFGVLLGATGGFLWGYLPAALLTGLFFEWSRRRLSRRSRICWVLGASLSCMFGALACYACGAVWYAWFASTSLFVAMRACVYPFLLFDLIKCLFASALGVRLRALLQARWFR